VWREFESLVGAGRVRQLGISNIYDLRALQNIYNDADVKPAVVQNRWGVLVWACQPESHGSSEVKGKARAKLSAELVVRGRHPCRYFVCYVWRHCFLRLHITEHNTHLFRAVTKQNPAQHTSVTTVSFVCCAVLCYAVLCCVVQVSQQDRV
jgi:hypothetical protein